MHSPKILRSLTALFMKIMLCCIKLGNANMRNKISCCLLIICTPFFVGSNYAQVPPFNISMRAVKQIPLPAGYERVEVSLSSFAQWLRELPLRNDKTVYLYNHQPKSDQSLHYAVIALSTGDKDLQQCADVVMRLRAEYFYNKKMYDSIRFLKGDGGWYQYSRFLKPGETATRENFMRFMEMIFTNCGSYNLQRQLKPVKEIVTMRPGDVFIKGGTPGHAEIVVDMAIHKQTGRKIYLLLEGYMPAQDMHILLNPLNIGLGPWYELSNQKNITTPTWVFTSDQLRKF
jgi:hypothetical protein